MFDGQTWAMLLRGAYLPLHRAAGALFAKRRMTADQFVLLSLLAERDDVMQQDLVRRSGSDPNTIRAMLVLLERAGFVKRRRHPEDRRARSVVLTAQGRAMQRHLRRDAENFHARIAEAIPAADARQVATVLRSLGQLFDDRSPRDLPIPASSK
ncbi:MAG: MarR family transcriptional regulator [Pirellulales bacterium]